LIYTAFQNEIAEKRGGDERDDRLIQRRVTRFKIVTVEEKTTERNGRRDERNTKILYVSLPIVTLPDLESSLLSRLLPPLPFSTLAFDVEHNLGVFC
jgi:hypothetical protein